MGVGKPSALPGYAERRRDGALRTLFPNIMELVGVVIHSEHRAVLKNSPVRRFRRINSANTTTATISAMPPTMTPMAMAALRSLSLEGSS
jgi:hypothetical protein